MYVDDLIVTGTNVAAIRSFKQQMTKEFEMSDPGILSYYLGIEVEQAKHSITLKQTSYARKIL